MKVREWASPGGRSGNRLWASPGFSSLAAPGYGTTTNTLLTLLNPLGTRISKTQIRIHTSQVVIAARFRLNNL